MQESSLASPTSSSCSRGPAHFRTRMSPSLVHARARMSIRGKIRLARETRLGRQARGFESALSF